MWSPTVGKVVLEVPVDRAAKVGAEDPVEVRSAFVLGEDPVVPTARLARRVRKDRPVRTGAPECS
jgi:hypothetical protein